MGKRGTKPDSKEKSQLIGSRRAKDKEDSISANPFRSECPDWLDDVAKEKWYSLVSRMAAIGYIGDLDEEIVSEYCLWWSKLLYLVEECPNDVHLIGKATDYLLKIGARLGLSPSDRVNIPQAKKEDKKDEKSYSIKFG